MTPLDSSVHETDLSRVYEHFESERPIAILSAFREEDSYSENDAHNRLLACKFKKAKYGYFFLEGHWEVDDAGNKSPAKEDSVLALGTANDSGRLKKLALTLAKQYEQESVLFKSEGQTGVSLIYQDGTVKDIGKFELSKLAEAYSRQRGKAAQTFVFDGTRNGLNWIENMGKLAEERGRD